MVVYDPGQVENIYPHLNFDPEWFLLGGPADANEAQCLRQKFPDLAIVGFEPNPRFYRLQVARAFPGLLLPFALWEERKAMEIRTVDNEEGEHQEHRCASLTVYAKHPAVRQSISVEARMLDDLSEEFGPFRQAILWIDIEESELQALRGAQKLLAAGEIRLINAELSQERLPPVAELLKEYGIREVGRWNANTVRTDDGRFRHWWNVIFRSER
jgi:FkbM family methyltransferase